ncbi:MAG: PTS sugar transporter subunit IIB [Spirochaetaceae bacterium]|nr:PTS sugar transporter subunit IIB [Spirochaetaceae bacterium]
MKIVLVCTAGMSTSILVQKMKDAAKAKSVDADISAVAEPDFAEHSAGVNVLLLGPQARFKFEQLKAEYEPKGLKVAVINAVDYGRMNGEKVLDMALSL